MQPRAKIEKLSPKAIAIGACFFTPTDRLDIEDRSLVHDWAKDGLRELVQAGVIEVTSKSREETDPLSFVRLQDCSALMDWLIRPSNYHHSRETIFKPAKPRTLF